MMTTRWGRNFFCVVMLVSAHTDILADNQQPIVVKPKAEAQASTTENNSNKEAKLPALSSLLEGMSRSFEELDYEAELVFIHDGQVESMRLLHASDKDRELEQLTYLSGIHREILRDNDTLICQFNDEKPFIAGKGKHRVFSSNPIVDKIKRLNTNYKYRLIGRDRVANRAAFVVDMRSLDDNLYGYRFWIDKESGLVLRADVVSGEEIVEQFVMVSLTLKKDIAISSFNPQLLASAKSLKSQSPPEAVSQESTKKVLPILENSWRVTWMPSGFHLKARRQQVRAGENTAKLHHLLYSNGVTAISVYILESQNRDVGSSNVVKRGSVTIYDLAQREFRVTVVGDIPKPTAEKIARSVTP